MQKHINKSPRPLFFLLILLVSSATVVSSFATAIGRRTVADGFLMDSTALSCTASKTVLYAPGGMSFGVRLSTKGVLVVGFTKGTDGSCCPAEAAGLRRGDVIERVNEKAVNSASELVSCIETSGGREVTLSVLRNEAPMTLRFLPQKDSSGVYRAGVWVRDSTAGIGTVTMVDPESGCFFGLGHGICDSDTGVLMPLLKGNVYDISVVAVRKGKVGAPGELKGYFSSVLSGILLRNTASGVYGRYSSLEGLMLGQPMPLAARREVKVGKATIYSTLTDGETRAYEVVISKISNPDGDAKNFVIEVTDDALLAETGGIVQGMSGSPVIQNGKIVGAVTHVMVNDPTKGYGIFIDNMLEIAS